MSSDRTHQPAAPPARHPGRRDRLRAALRALAALLSALPGCQRAREQAAGVLPPGARPPDIVLLVIDTLRADRLGAYGHPGNLTPTMDSIAAAGVTFDRAIAAAPWTQPSVASLFTSCYPAVHKVVRYGPAAAGPRVRALGRGFRTLAEVLKAGGYRTAAFVANPFVVPELGFEQGFDHFDASFARNTTPGHVVNRALTAWLADRDRSRPLLLYLHYMDVHGPYDAEPRFIDPLLAALEREPDKHLLTDRQMRALNYLLRPPARMSDPAQHRRLRRYREYWVARYEAGVRQADYYLAQLRDRLSALRLWQEAYVILTADHGEALCEHGLWDHGLSVHHNQLHVPLILRWPGVLPAGKHVRPLVRLIDLLPTLVAQLRLPGLTGIQGSSLLPLLSGRPSAPPLIAFAETVKLGPEQKALYRGDWKLIYRQTSPPRQALFNIASDPLEQHNLARTHAVELAGLLGALKQQLLANQRRARQVPATQAPLDQAWRRRLQDLGYAGQASAPASRPQPPPAR